MLTPNEYEQLNQLSDEILNYREGDFEDMIEEVKRLKKIERLHTISKNKLDILTIIDDLKSSVEEI